jgi:preprotein translocase subunit YajC
LIAETAGARGIMIKFPRFQRPASRVFAELYIIGAIPMLISPAFAQGTGGTPGAGFESMILIVLMFGVLYFMMIRPQMKRAKEQKAMIEALQKGDEVITAGGILGRIVKLSEGYVTLEIAPNVEVQTQRAAVQLVLPKGTIKNL